MTSTTETLKIHNREKLLIHLAESPASCCSSTADAVEFQVVPLVFAILNFRLTFFPPSYTLPLDEWLGNNSTTDKRNSEQSERSLRPTRWCCWCLTCFRFPSAHSPILLCSDIIHNNFTFLIVNFRLSEILALVDVQKFKLLRLIIARMSGNFIRFDAGNCTLSPSEWSWLSYSVFGWVDINGEEFIELIEDATN